MKRTFRIGPFLPAAAIAAALCICLILASLPATAVVTPQTRTTQPQAVRSASEPAVSEQAARRLHVSYAAPAENAATPGAAEEDSAPQQQMPAEPVTDSAQGAELPSGQETPAEKVQPADGDADADAVPDDLVLLDTFIATAYCVTGTTSTGTYTTAGRTLAVNPNIIPYGTHVWLYLDDGTLVGDYYAEDTGSNMMAHPYVIDIYMGEGSYNDCILWGAQHVSVYVEGEAS